MATRPFELGQARGILGDGVEAYALPAHHLVTHGVVVGMTGSGKTGLCMVLVEEALRSGVPVLLVDVKGDLANLLFTFPGLSAEEFLPWVDADAARREGTTPEAKAATLAARWREGLGAWGLGPRDVAALRASTALRVITPGTGAGEALDVLSALERPSRQWELDAEGARESLAAAVSLLLRLLRRDGDATRGREHVLLSHFAERRLRAGRGAGLEALVQDLQRPPLARVGALALDEFLPEPERARLAQDLNTLIASPTFASWRQGTGLDPGAWLAHRDGRTPAAILSVAHLDDDERMLVLSLVLEQVLAWVRGLPGTSELRALVLLDEVYGFLPPHPAAPPTKRPLLALMKQARAFGVGVVVATQNPMDLDYKALSNAGVWFVGRLQTDADRERVVEGLSGAGAAGADPASLGALLKAMPGRTFYVRDVHDARGARRLETRWSLAWLRGPVTRQEIRRLLRGKEGSPAPGPPAAQPVALPPTRELPAVEHVSTEVAVPVAPPAWRTSFAPAPPGLAPGPWRYEPWVAATIVAHVRDAKLGVHTTRTVRAMAPLGPDGRPDTARGWPFDPAQLGAAPDPRGTFAPLPDALLRKGGAAAVERALRDEVYRTLRLEVWTHRDLALVSSDGESAEAFARRCEAGARAAQHAEQELVAGRHAARIQRAADKVAAARSALAAAEAESPVGSGVAAAAAVLVGGRRVLRRIETQQDRQAARRTKAAQDVARAEAEHREAVARRDAELAAAAQQAARYALGIEARTLAARRDDVSVTTIGVVWVPTR